MKLSSHTSKLTEPPGHQLLTRPSSEVRTKPPSLRDGPAIFALEGMDGVGRDVSMASSSAASVQSVEALRSEAN